MTHADGWIDGPPKDNRTYLLIIRCGTGDNHMVTGYWGSRHKIVYSYGVAFSNAKIIAHRELPPIPDRYKEKP